MANNVFNKVNFVVIFVTMFLGNIYRFFDLILDFCLFFSGGRETKLKHMKWRKNKVVICMALRARDRVDQSN